MVKTDDLGVEGRMALLKNSELVKLSSSNSSFIISLSISIELGAASDSVLHG